MSSVNELINAPREITISDRTLKVRQLKIKELFGYFENKIRDKKLKEAQEMANMLEGADKSKFLVEVWKNLPSGSELTDMTTDMLSSVEGVIDILYLASKDCNNDNGVTKIEYDDIKGLVDIGELDTLAPIITWIMGTEAEESTEEGLENTENTEKKTEL